MGSVVSGCSGIRSEFIPTIEKSMFNKLVFLSLNQSVINTWMVHEWFMEKSDLKFSGIGYWQLSAQNAKAESCVHEALGT